MFLRVFCRKRILEKGEAVPMLCEIVRQSGELFTDDKHVCHIAYYT